jgi:hypothetical protein
MSTTLQELQRIAVDRRERDIRLGKVPGANVVKLRENCVADSLARQADPRSSTSVLTEKPAGAVTVPIAESSLVNIDTATQRRLLLGELLGDLRQLQKRVRQALMDEASTDLDRAHIRDIAQVVCKFYGVSMHEVTSPRRHPQVVRPRQVAMYLARELTLHSLPTIGRAIGARDHTTVLHAVKKITEEREKNSQLDGELRELTAKLERK